MNDEEFAILHPCPFCGGTNLVINLWSTDHGEIDAIECNDCLGAAPKSVWETARIDA